MSEHIYITTPMGKKVMHGELRGNVFYRTVKEKDRMRIFDAWSINPRVLEDIKSHVETLEFYNADDKLTYTIPIQEALRNGFEREFSGGKTFYIPIRLWTIDRANETLLKELSQQSLL
jgi:hypothetical protein